MGDTMYLPIRANVVQVLKWIQHHINLWTLGRPNEVGKWCCMREEAYRERRGRHLSQRLLTLSICDDLSLTRLGLFVLPLEGRQNAGGFRRSNQNRVRAPHKNCVVIRLCREPFAPLRLGTIFSGWISLFNLGVVIVMWRWH